MMSAAPEPTPATLPAMSTTATLVLADDQVMAWFVFAVRLIQLPDCCHETVDATDVQFVISDGTCSDKPV